MIDRRPSFGPTLEASIVGLSLCAQIISENLVTFYRFRAARVRLHLLRRNAISAQLATGLRFILNVSCGPHVNLYGGFGFVCAHTAPLQTRLVLF